jgi:ABC-type glycerol-3-phosphate transport system substrate-binding protein
MSGQKKVSRRAFLRAFGVGAAAAALGACAPKTVVVEKEVTREVEKVVKETVLVEGTPVEVTKVVKETVVVQQEVEKEVTRVVAQEPESGEIVFWSWDEATQKPLIEGFEAKFPGFTVKHELTQNYYDTFLASLVAGAGLPDCAWCDAHAYQKFARTGQLIALDEYLVPYREDIMPFLWDAGLVEGKQYGAARRYASEMIWYRKDRFEAVGIDPEALETWDDLLLLGQQAATDDEHFMTCYDQAGFDYALQSMLFGEEGTGFYDAEDNVVVNSAENVANLEKFLQIVQSGIARPVEYWGPDWYSIADTAKIACITMPYWYGYEPMYSMPSPENKGNWGVLPIPSLKPGGKNASVWQGAMYWVIPKAGKNRELGWKFIDYTTFDYADAYVQMSMDLEFVLPAYKKFYEIDFPFWGEAMSFYGENLRERANELSQGAPVNYLPPEYNESEAALVAELQRMFAGEQTPKQALDNAAKEFETLLMAR